MYSVEGGMSVALNSADYYVNQKILQLRSRESSAYILAKRTLILYETAKRVDEEVAKTINTNQNRFFNDNKHLRPKRRTSNIVKYIVIGVVVVVVVLVAWKVGLIALIAKAVGGALLSTGKAIALTIKGMTIKSKIVLVYNLVDFGFKALHRFGLTEFSKITDIGRGHNKPLNYIMLGIDATMFVLTVVSLPKDIRMMKYSLTDLSTAWKWRAVVNVNIFTEIAFSAFSVGKIINDLDDSYSDGASYIKHLINKSTINRFPDATPAINLGAVLRIPPVIRTELPSLSFVIPQQNFTIAK